MRLWLIGSLTLIALGIAPPARAVPQAIGPWEHVFAANGVVVEWRKVRGSAMKEIRATVEVQMGAERLFAALTDVPRYPKFMPPTVESRMLKREGDSAWFYLVIDPPLVRKRDYCVKVTASRHLDGRLQSTWRDFSEGCPTATSAKVRMKQTEGQWTLTPRGAEMTHLDYQAFTDPSGALPAWLVNRSTARAMREMFDGLIAAARDPRYTTCRGESFGCGAAP